ncbi:rCG20052, partial [Rattus norvegicus]
MADSQSSSGKVRNSSLCTSKTLSLETQPPTSVQ